MPSAFDVIRVFHKSVFPPPMQIPRIYQRSTLNSISLSLSLSLSLDPRIIEQQPQCTEQYIVCLLRSSVYLDEATTTKIPRLRCLCYILLYACM